MLISCPSLKAGPKNDTVIGIWSAAMAAGTTISGRPASLPTPVPFEHVGAGLVGSGAARGATFGVGVGVDGKNIAVRWYFSITASMPSVNAGIMTFVSEM